MGQVLIRNLDDGLIDEFRQAAKANGRSLEAELRDALARARQEARVRPYRSKEELVELSRRLREESAIPGAPQTPGWQLIREDRDGFRGE